MTLNSQRQTLNHGKPRLAHVPLLQALSWRPDPHFLYEEKIDGQWSVQHTGASILGGEQVKLSRRGGQSEVAFYPLSVIQHRSEDCTKWPFRENRALLNSILNSSFVLQNASFKIPRRGAGGEFLEAILRDGGEGIVAHPLDQPFGTGYKAKRLENFECIVTGLLPATGVVILADRLTLEPRGKMKLHGQKFLSLRIGSLLKINAFGLHPQTRLLREARPDTDTPASWLIQY